MKYNLEKDNLFYLIFKYCIPSVLSMWIYGTYSIIDGIFISRFLGESALASVNIVLPFINFSFAFGIMIAVGAGTIMSIKLGEKDSKGCNFFYSLATLTLIVVGLLISIFGIFFSNEIVKILGAPSSIISSSGTYLKTLSFFIITFLLGYGLEIFVRIDGSPAYSIICLILGAVTNIVLDYLFIVKLNWGISGAALATGIGQTSTVIPLLYYLTLKKKNLHFNFVKPQLQKLKDIFFIGSPEFITEVSTGLIIISFNYHIGKTLGESGISSFGVINYLSTFIIMTMIGFSQGLQPITSFNLGAKNITRVKEIIKTALFILFIIGCSFYSIINIFSNFITKFFISNNIILLQNTEIALKYYSFSYILMGCNILIISFLTSIEESIKSNFLSILRGIIFINIILVISPYFLGIKGLWLASFFNEIIIFFIAFKTLNKIRKGVLC